MSNREISETARLLIDTKKRIENPKDWSAGSYGVGTNKRCVFSAMFDAVGREYSGRHQRRRCGDALENSARVLFKGLGLYAVVEVNDRLGHLSVMQMLDHAIQCELNRK